MILGVSAACVFSCVLGFEFSKFFFVFPWFALCARKGRTSRSHRKNQWISSIFHLPRSRRRAPRQAEHQRHHVQERHQKTLEKIQKSHTFEVPGAISRQVAKRSPKRHPRGGQNGAKLGPWPPPLEAEISSRCVSWPHPRATSEFLGAPGRLQERPGADFGALLGCPLGPHGGQKRPGGVRALILVSPGCLRGAFWEPF